MNIRGRLTHIATSVRSFLHQTYRRLKGCCIAFKRKQRNAMCRVETTPQRITAKTTYLYFADLWGLGDRSIFVAIWHLMWRPGYMIRDYLEGRRSRYLQPVKTLIVTTLILTQVAWMLNVDMPRWECKTHKVEKKLADVSDSNAKTFIISLSKYYDTYRLWRDNHRAFGMLTHSVVCILLTWLLFRKSPRKSGQTYNLAEVTTAFVYILAQLQVLTILYMIVTHDLNTFGSVILLPPLLMNIVILIDFKQLFQRSWWGTIWRTFLSLAWVL